MSNVLIITVNFRRADCTAEFLKSASQMEDFARCHLIVVDNDSGDNSVGCLGRASADFDNVEILASTKNRGYFGGAKWGLDHYLATHCLPDWAIVCNNDITFDQPSFLKTLRAHDPRTEGVVAPSVVSRLTGFDSNPMIRTRPSAARLLRYRMLLSSYYMAWLAQWSAPVVRKIRRRLRRKTVRSQVGARMYAPHGAIFIFSRTFFERGGFLDDGCFLYAEEFSVAETCLRLGLPIIHDPKLTVVHNDNQTTGRSLTRAGYLHQKEGLRYTLEKYFRSGSAQPTLPSIEARDSAAD